MNVQDDFVRKLLSQDKRPDGRKLDQMRDVKIEMGPAGKAEGSALVRLGRTKVVAGVKMDVGEPFSDRPDEGVLMTNAELSPISSPDFEPGPPSEEGVELARVVDRGIRESQTLDLKKLCIKKGEKVWMVFVDVNILDDFGNIMDAASIASAAALSQAVFPKLEKDAVVYTEKTAKKVPVKYKPISCTFSKIGDRLVLDPIREEEDAASARLTVTTKDDGNVAALQKGGTGHFTVEEVGKALDIAVEKGREIRKLIK
jgi:exosome complex component RRP42